MAQIAMSHEQRIQALRLFNYAPREAEFLCLAALHGGYFLRRQYSRFLGGERSGTVAALIERASANNHVRAAVFERNAHLYHLGARPFYAAIGQPDNRNRRERQPLTVKNKLMGLDFVLAHHGIRFLATEQEKLDYFIARGVEVSRLPAKRYSAATAGVSTVRYFVDKFPICVEGAALTGEERISFCFIDEGLTTASKFESYLNDYRVLFSVLPACRVVYVAASPAPFSRAARVFERLVSSILGNGGESTLDPASVRLAEFFGLRKRFEANDWSAFTRDQLVRLREGHKEFRGDQYETLFRRWVADGDAVFTTLDKDAAMRGQPAVPSFSTHLLEHNYDLFGTLTSY